MPVLSKPAGPKPVGLVLTAVPVGKAAPAGLVMSAPPLAKGMAAAWLGGSSSAPPPPPPGPPPVGKGWSIPLPKGPPKAAPPPPAVVTGIPVATAGGGQTVVGTVVTDQNDMPVQPGSSSGGLAPGERVALTKGRKLDNFMAKREQTTGKPVQCKDCQLYLKKFEYAWQIKTVQGQVQEFMQDPVEETKWVYQCAACLSIELGITHEEAIEMIVKNKTDWGRKRALEFRENKANVQDVFMMVGGDPSACTKKDMKKQMRNMCMIPRQDFVLLFAPWSTFIRIKNARLEKHADLMDKYNELVSQVSSVAKCIGDGTMPEGAFDQLHAQLTAMEDKLEELERPIAFEDKGIDMQKAYLIATEYMDEWINVGNGAMYMRSWYLCECGACLSSKSWVTLFPELQDNEWRKGQRYYCVFCNRRYRPKMGQLVETKLKSGIYWALARMPPKEIEDLRAMAVEQDFKDQKIDIPTPLELYNSIKQYVPVTGQGILRPAQHSDIWYPQNSKDPSKLLTMCSMLTPEGRKVLQTAPLFNWMQILNFV